MHGGELPWIWEGGENAKKQWGCAFFFFRKNFFHHLCQLNASPFVLSKLYGRLLLAYSTVCAEIHKKSSGLKHLLTV